MSKKIFYILLYLLYCALTAATVFAQPDLDADQAAQSSVALENRLAAINNLESIKASDRILILAPHPDDESIGCAGVIQEAVRAGADTHVLCLTNGDNNEFAFIVYEKRIPILPVELVHLGQIRRSESIKAMKNLGLEEYNLIYLGYPDFGIFQIFKDFWQSKRPYKSLLTRSTSVPYKEDPTFGSPYTGESILRDLGNVLLRYKPNKIFVSHPADANHDHKGLYLFLEIALADTASQLPRPKVYPYLVHWRGWPLPRHYHPELPLLPPEGFSPDCSEIRWLKYKLPTQYLENKHRAVLTYRSQTQSSAFYLLSFCRKNELFSTYPEINLSLLPKPAAERLLSLKDKIIAFFGLTGNLPETGMETAVEAPKIGSPVAYSSEGDSFLIRIYKRKDIGRTLKTVVYLFGYSRKTAFAKMPKIFLITKYTGFKIFDGAKAIAPQGVSLELKPEELVIKIPFAVLGDPDFILASVRGNSGVSHVDTLSFRKVNIIRRRP